MTDTKKRIMTLVGRYGSERAQEELAGARDAPHPVVKRYVDRADKLWDSISAEIDSLIAGQR